MLLGGRLLPEPCDPDASIWLLCDALRCNFDHVGLNVVTTAGSFVTEAGT